MKTILTILTLLLTVNLSFGQLTMTVQPSGGLNDGTDSGTAIAGKDAWVNRYAPTSNYGDQMVTLASPRSNCNPSDYKSYFQFDVTNLPALVDSVFFGVTHNEHTSYCYSNCNADFYFYRLTSPWDEMALIQSNLPSEDSTPFFGPLNITFPNDFKNQEYDITSAYNYWKTPGNNNYGFTVYSPTVGCNNAAVIFNVQSSDDTVASARPYLKIYYRFPAAVNETENSMDVNVFPNPFHDALKVDIQNPDKIFISDITGRIFNLPFEPSTNKLNTKILNPGIYILHIEKDDKIYNSKVLKK